MHQPRRHGGDDVSFSAYNVDNEDYFAFLPSDESMSDVEDTPMSIVVTKTRDPVEELASVFASSSSINSSRILTPTSSLNGSRPTHKATKRTQEQMKAPAPGVFELGGGEELRVSPRALEQHTARQTHLQEALDTATDNSMSDGGYGEAPFRFQAQCKKRVTFAEAMEVSGASPSPVTERAEGHAPEKKSLGRRRPVAKREDDYDEDEEENETGETDPLYDEQLDDADEQWVQTTLCGTRATKLETDATLCCPCCFVTVCMVCERHATYTNQYRATAAINCRVKRDEILAYTSGEGSQVPASLPFHKRQTLVASNKATSSGQQLARLLQEDEFYPVACSDCGTMVGVFDRDQHYHFFNALPSNC
ncbi:E2F-associated phosphoprotein [Phytophthora infestans]|uniref:E2F-associated phosphoprotein n=1 Tax=Phytophthora infestans TaxID=4787 RepID=A0A8S9VA28_PHYIN|nr:E2F-associated phosphoprotein [Phytophthora infestans]